MTNNNKKISLLSAISIGIGGMVGGGIFAVLGLAVSLAEGSTPIAFLIAGIIAIITSYSYTKLSLVYPDRGGTVRFINQSFGKSIFSGAMNNLLWVSYIIMLSLYASAFASYAPNLLKITNQPQTDFHIYASAIVILCAFINYYSVNVVSIIEAYAVYIKLVILIVFVFIGGYGLIGNPNLNQLTTNFWVSPISMITGGMVIFVAYEGFELIANSVPDLKNPTKNVPRAYYISVFFVVLLYLAIAVVTVGSLPFKEIAKAKDYVLAEAAEPMTGKIGFTIITIAAVISTFSAINASLYGGTRVNYEIAKDDELPHHFTYMFWNQPIGLFITTILTIIFVNFVPLESISTTGSIGFLIVFGLVNFSGYKLSSKINANKIIPILGTILCFVALIALISQQLKDNTMSIVISISIIIGCVVLETAYKKTKKN